MSQKDIACFAACHEERPLPFDVQLIVQLFSPEMLDADLDFRLFARVFNLKKSDVKSVLTGRIMYNFLPTFGAKNMDKKLELTQNPTFLPTFWQKKLEESWT
ncbi:MAG: hypothetical protein IKD91_03935, partial [Clostridiales bacterium]|nr:hypothetical protein [Clostridiales bacterium]